MPELKIFIWPEFCPDCDNGLAFAIAETEEDARAMVMQSYGFEVRQWGEMIVVPITEKNRDGASWMQQITAEKIKMEKLVIPCFDEYDSSGVSGSTGATRGSKKRSKKKRGSSTPGRQKVERCQASPRRRIYARRSRSYKMKNYASFIPERKV